MPDHGEQGALGEDAGLDEIITRACVVVPEQGPLPAFVHHNTLHHFEHLPFAAGVVASAHLLGSQPFQTETAFGAHLQSGRILPRDIDAVMSLESTDLSRRVFGGGPTLRELRTQRLRYVFEIPKAKALEWLLHEDGRALADCHPLTTMLRRAELERYANQRFVDSPRPLTLLLHRLWETFDRTAEPAADHEHRVSPRPRDRIWAAYGIDTDLAVHSLLIRFTSSYLDQGLAYWAMPDREHGMLHTFRALYGQAGGPPDAAFHGLDVELRHQHAENWDAERTISWALGQLEVPRKHWLSVIQSTLQSLRGWAGMVRQFELRPDWAPVAAPPARLKEYLAIHLLLDWVGAKNVRENHPAPAVHDVGLTNLPSATAYEAFVLAQLCDVDPTLLLDRHNAKAWLDACAAFDELERRRLWHLAYERRYRTEVLDALRAHLDDPHPTPKRATYQAVFCIDDREESLRRHLEETFPDVQSFGFAGFFGVAMQYQGINDIRPRALCPVVVTPIHLVREVAIDATEHARHSKNRATKGKFEHGLTVGSRTLVRGGLLSAGIGLTALVPLVGRSLFPRLTHRWLRDKDTPPKTRLAIEREPGAPLQDGLHVGFTIAEMADIVDGALQTLGIARNLSSIVLVVGHGSSSLNNPHKAAYDCGATGGGRGGPNARAFAAMANHPQVRQELARRGTTIPADTYFVGGFHNTSDDSLTYFDLDLMPNEFVTTFGKLRSALEKASELDAHERCRRFAHAPLGMSPHEALSHVEGRAADIGQPRPECGHATNAICIVGRRERTRGLFLDRRAFLVTYDPTTDPTEEILGNVMQAVGPVGAGINLEYYFSYVDPKNYGCGSKLPHNVVGLFSVMDGHASDLRTGLPWQMVEIHEPVRLLTIVEAKPETLLRLLEKRPVLAPLVRNQWILLVAMDPDSSALFVFEGGEFKPYEPERRDIPTFASSVDVYQGSRDHLACVRLQKPHGLEAHP